MAACENRIASLVDAAAGELSRADERDLQAHLDVCAACRSELAELRGTESLLRVTSCAPDELHLTGFAYRTADRAEKFRDRSARGLWWSLTCGVRVAMTLSTSALVASLAVFAALRPHLKAAPVAPAPVEANAAGDVVGPWEDYVPEAIHTVHEQGPEFDDDADGHIASLDFGLESLSADEMDVLSQELDPAAG